MFEIRSFSSEIFLQCCQRSARSSWLRSSVEILLILSRCHQSDFQYCCLFVQRLPLHWQVPLFDSESLSKRLDAYPDQSGALRTRKIFVESDKDDTVTTAHFQYTSIREVVQVANIFLLFGHLFTLTKIITPAESNHPTHFSLNNNYTRYNTILIPDVILIRARKKRSWKL